MGDSKVENKSLDFIKKQFINGLENTFKKFSTLKFDIILNNTDKNKTTLENTKLNPSHFIKKNG